MDTVSSHDSTDTVRLPGELRHSRVVGTVFLVLALVGVKMLAHSWLKGVLGPNFNLYLLGLVLTILALGVLGFLIMLFCLLVIERNVRKIGRAGFESLAGNARVGSSFKGVFGTTRGRWRER